MHNYVNLNNIIREYMVEAIDEAFQTGNIYFSTIFTEDAKTNWITILKKAAVKYDEDWLAEELNKRKSFLEKNPKNGKSTPWNAAQTLASGQFKRFYILGLCKFAKKNSISKLIVYRALQTDSHRAESDEIIGTSFNVEDIERELQDIDRVFTNPFTKPNSGICLMIP